MSKPARIVIMGAGVVGTATGIGFERQGHHVTFIDIAPARLEALSTRGSHATDTLVLPDEPTTIFLTLPTPNDGYRWDLSTFMSGTQTVGSAMARSNGYHTVVVRSTVPPGTCEGLVQPLLEESSGLQVGDGFALGSNPEFLRAACALEDFLSPWMTVVASRSKRTTERLSVLLAPFGGELRRYNNPNLVEMIKCAHNIYNAAKISFWNEMTQVSERLGVDAIEVASVVSRSAEGSINAEYGIRGGAPYGGACLPKDTKGFLGFADELGVPMPLLSAVDQVNEHLLRAMNGVPSAAAPSLDLRDT